MSKIKKKNRKQKPKAVVRTVLDVLPIAYYADLPCPPGENDSLTAEEMQRDFPHLTTLFLIHKGHQKSTSLITHNAKVLADIEADELVQLEIDELIKLGLKVPAALIEAAEADETTLEDLEEEERKQIEEATEMAKVMQQADRNAAMLPKVATPPSWSVPKNTDDA